MQRKREHGIESLQMPALSSDFESLERPSQLDDLLLGRIERGGGATS
jgi:hypothetical protein